MLAFLAKFLQSVSGNRSRSLTVPNTTLPAWPPEADTKMTSPSVIHYIYSGQFNIIERLPPELQLEVVDHLDYQSVIRMSQVNTYFHNFVKPEAWSLEEREKFVYQHQFHKKHNEVSMDYTLGSGSKVIVHTDGYACHYCCRVKPKNAFTRRQTERSYSKIDAVSYEFDHWRFCIECGIARGKYLPGTILTTAFPRFRFEKASTSNNTGYVIHFMVCVQCNLPASLESVEALPICLGCRAVHQNVPAPMPGRIRFSKPGSTTAVIEVRCAECNHVQDILVPFKICIYCRSPMCQEGFSRMDDAARGQFCPDCAWKGSSRVTELEDAEIKFKSAAKVSRTLQKLDKSERRKDLYATDEDYLLASLSLHDDG